MKKQSKIMIAVAAAVAVIAVAAVALVLGAKGGEDSFAAHMELARQYIDELNYERAIAELQMAIELDPAGVEAYLALAEVYVAMEDYDSAVAILERGLAATGDGEILSRLEELRQQRDGSPNGGQAELTEDQKKLVQFCEKYDGLTERVWNALASQSGASQWVYFLTRAKREETFRPLIEELTAYLEDLAAIEGLLEQMGYGYQTVDDYYGLIYEDYLYGEDGDAARPFTKNGAYDRLDRLCRNADDMERSLAVRTAWAEACGRPELVQDGYDGSGGSSTIRILCDRYGRQIEIHRSAEEYPDNPNMADGTSEYLEYGEEHSDVLRRRLIWNGSGHTDDTVYFYDSEGRLTGSHMESTPSGNGTPSFVEDNAYTYVDDHTVLQRRTMIWPDETRIIEYELTLDDYGFLLETVGRGETVTESAGG